MSESSRYRIRIEVRTAYVESQSQPGKDRYTFAYTITLTNDGTVGAQLLTRHWVITDSRHKVIEVRGDGVIGKKPHLEPGGRFRYTSGTVLETPVGTMHGSYGLVAEDGTRFEAEIPEFTLAVPRTLH